MKKSVLVFAFCIVTGLQALNAQSAVYQTRTGEAKFVSEAPKETVVGVSSFLNGRISLASKEVDFYLDLSTIKTGIALRDEHMRENYLEVDKFPFAEFFGTMTQAFDPNKQGLQPVEVKGTFTVHGQSQEVTITGTAEVTSEGIEILASWPIQLSDYQIPIPKVLYYRLSNDMILSLDAMMTGRNL